MNNFSLKDIAEAKKTEEYWYQDLLITFSIFLENACCNRHISFDYLRRKLNMRAIPFQEIVDAMPEARLDLATMSRMAFALGMKIELKLVPIDENKDRVDE